MKHTKLIIRHIDAYVGEKQVLYDVSFLAKGGTITVIMGPNGSGKSTFVHAVMGDSRYEVKSTKPDFCLSLNGKNIASFSAFERAKIGLFLGLQFPTAVPGVNIMDLLRARDYKRRRGSPETFAQLHTRVNTFAEALGIQANLLKRSIHQGFSGGEKKKIELLEALVVKPSFAFLDEIDTGVDVDGQKRILWGIRELRKIGTGIIFITHNSHLVRNLPVDTVCVMVGGRIVQKGNSSLISTIEKKGYGQFV